MGDCPGEAGLNAVAQWQGGPHLCHVSIYSRFGTFSFSGFRAQSCAMRGRSSMVEQQPSKLMTRVRFPSPAPMET